MNKENLEVLEKFERAVDRSKYFFRPGLSCRLKRFISSPGKILIRVIDFKVLGHKHTFRQKTKIFFGDTMYVQNFEQDLIFFGFIDCGPEIRLTKYVIKTLGPEDVFYDVGANRGFYSLLARKLLGSGEIHSFEPSPKTFAYLGMNCNGSNVFLNNTAVSYCSDIIDFYDASEGGKSGISTISKEVVAGKNSSLFNLVKVKTVTLDDYCDTHKPPTFIKIDVEGAEPYVLKGAEKTLNKYNPVIAMEVWRSSYGNANHVTAIEFLRINNFKPFRIRGDGTLQPMSDINPDRDILPEEGLDNFIFKKL